MTEHNIRAMPADEIIKLRESVEARWADKPHYTGELSPGCMMRAHEILSLIRAYDDAMEASDYWNVEADGERAKVAWRDEKSERLRKAFEDMVMMVDFETCKITIAFETTAKTDEAQQALSEAIG